MSLYLRYAFSEGVSAYKNTFFGQNRQKIILETKSDDTIVISIVFHPRIQIFMFRVQHGQHVEGHQYLKLEGKGVGAEKSSIKN